MISAGHRFHGYGSLRYLHSKGDIVRGQGLSVKYSHNPKRTSYRAAVVVSKKVHKSAVIRNRIRRRVYEVIRCNLSPESPYDLACMVYDATLADLSADELARRVVGLLGKAKLTKIQAA